MIFASKMRAGMSYPRLALFQRILLTGAALWALCLAVIDGYGSYDQAQPAQVIIILGSRVYPEGQPGPALIRRTRHAVALFQQDLAQQIICSGGLGTYPPTEAEAACALAESFNVPPAGIWIEDYAHSTEENALYTASLMRAHGWQTAILVSDGYHLYRAAFLFRRAGVVVYPSPAQITAGPMNPVERYVRESRELIALMWYWGKTAVGSQVTDFQ
jgi:uncharacterized SAM-binding protein YcdF (DUF218 family)